MAATLVEGTPLRFDRAPIVEALRSTAADPEPAVRTSAVRALGMVAPKVAPEPPSLLIRALEDDAEPVRAAAVIALTCFRQGLPKALPELARSCENARPEFRAGYAQVIEAIRPRDFTADAVPALAGALSSPDDGVRVAAANAIGAFGKEAQRAVPALIASLGRPSKAVPPPKDDVDPAVAAAQALARVGDAYSVAIDVGPSVDAGSLQTLAEVVTSGKPPVRRSVARALGHFEPTPGVVPVLGDLSADTDENVREAALRSLDEVGHRLAFVPPASVKRALEDPDRNVRFWAAGAVGHAGRGIDPFIPSMLRHAEHDSDAEVRNCFAMELRNFIKPPGVTSAVIPQLTEALKSTDRETRCAACSLLGKFGPDAVGLVPEMIRLLREGAELRRPVGGQDLTDQSVVAATALARVAPGTPRAREVAEALVKHAQAETWDRHTVEFLQALARFGPLARGAVPRLQEWERKATDVNAPGMVEAAREAIKALQADR
jgi:HEAT repeat protein